MRASRNVSIVSACASVMFSNDKLYTFGLNNDVDKMLDYIINITVSPIFNNKLVDREKKAVYNELLINIDRARYKLYKRIHKRNY